MAPTSLIRNNDKIHWKQYALSYKGVVVFCIQWQNDCNRNPASFGQPSLSFTEKGKITKGVALRLQG